MKFIVRPGINSRILCLPEGEELPRVINPLEWVGDTGSDQPLCGGTLNMELCKRSTSGYARISITGILEYEKRDGLYPLNAIADIRIWLGGYVYPGDRLTDEALQLIEAWMKPWLERTFGQTVELEFEL